MFNRKWFGNDKSNKINKVKIFINIYPANHELDINNIHVVSCKKHISPRKIDCNRTFFTNVVITDKVSKNYIPAILILVNP
jgi:hypothetical protein